MKKIRYELNRTKRTALKSLKAQQDTRNNLRIAGIIFFLIMATIHFFMYRQYKKEQAAPYVIMKLDNIETRYNRSRMLLHYVMKVSYKGKTFDLKASPDLVSTYTQKDTISVRYNEKEDYIALRGDSIMGIWSAFMIVAAIGGIIGYIIYNDTSKQIRSLEKQAHPEG